MGSSEFETILRAITGVEKKIDRLSDRICTQGERVAALEQDKKAVWNTIDKELRPAVQDHEDECIARSRAIKKANSRGTSAPPSKISTEKIKQILIIAATIGLFIGSIIGGMCGISALP